MSGAIPTGYTRSSEGENSASKRPPLVQPQANKLINLHTLNAKELHDDDTRYQELLAKTADMIASYSPTAGFARPPEEEESSASKRANWSQQTLSSAPSSSPEDNSDEVENITPLENVFSTQDLVSTITKVGSLSIKDIASLRKTDRNFLAQMNEHTSHELAVLQNKGPAFIKDFLSQRGDISQDTAWAILGGLKKTYPDLRLDLPIDQAIDQACIELEQKSLVALKQALLKQNLNNQALQNLTHVPDELDAIRAWFANEKNQGALQTVTQLNLNNCNLPMIPPEIKRLTNLQVLNLSSNKIAAIPPNAFLGLASLQELHLENNQITAISENAFLGLSSLQTLRLNYNKIAAIPPNAFLGLSSLRHLNLDNNQIAAIPENAFQGLSSLQTLYFYSNKIAAIPENAFLGLASLRNLSLSSNQIAAIPPNAFQGLSYLMWLHLDNNQIAAIPENAFQGLASLERLRLNNNPIEPNYPFNRQGLLPTLEIVW